MSVVSNIEWTDSSWNPVSGCTQISPGCANCYALTFAERFRGVPGNYYENGFDLQLRPSQLEKPLHWKKPRRIFVNSMSDLFHEDVPDEYIDRVFAVMALTPQHTYQILTKRPERMRAYFDGDSSIRWRHIQDAATPYVALPLPNVWLGVTVENQRWADERIPILLDTPAAVRFLSCEPLLEAIDIEHYVHAAWGPDEDERLDWVICGGESGPRHRPFDVDWARSLRDQCADAGVAYFCKQLGGIRPGNKLEDLPEDLRVREFPR